MAHKFRELREEVLRDPVRREQVKEISEAAETAFTLSKLRRRRGETQVRLAAKLATSQNNVSRMEHSENLYLSTLREYVAALGGELKIVASFPDGDVLLEPAMRAEPEPVQHERHR